MSRHIRIAIGLIVVLSAGSLAFMHPSATDSTAQAASQDTWTFDLDRAQDLRHGDGTESMVAFLFDVDTDGALTLQRSFRLDGIAPPSRELPDWGRTYEWRLLDEEDHVLRRGRHFDRLAQYTIRPDGGCDKSVVGAHVMMLRVPNDPRAVRIDISIDSLRTDREDG